MTTVDVSVVVCTYNRAALLRDALQSVLDQQTGNAFRFEVVVVNNGCTDDTESTIATVQERAPVPVRQVREDRSGVAAARNCGVLAARGSWIAFFDDDQVAEPDWLAQLYAAARQFDARCVAGAVHLLLPADVAGRLAPRCRQLLGELRPVEHARPLTKSMGAGTGNLLVQKSVFDHIGMFDETLVQAGEDTDLLDRVKNAGIEAWFTPLAVVGHVVPPHRLTDDYFRWASLRSGTYIARHDRRRWGAIGFPFLLFGRLAQIILVFLPQWAWGYIVRSPVLVQNGRCLLWRAEGYMRSVLAWLSPSKTIRATLEAQTDFRSERERFAQAAELDRNNDG